MNCLKFKVVTLRVNLKLIFVLLIPLLFLFSCYNSEDPNAGSPQAPESIQLSQSFFYEINLKDRSGDTFKVRMFLSGLTNDNDIFQFPATVPGTYSIADYGRFVSKFKVFDENYHEISVENTSTNQWRISSPSDAYVIEYEIFETWDTLVSSNKIYKMAGTSIEEDHVLLNTFAVLGYPTGLKKRKFILDIDYPFSWKFGTSLEQTIEGYFTAEDYDKLVDSPILFGDISIANTQIDITDINVFTYSKSNQILSSQILTDVEQVLLDAKQFLNGLPVNRYSFIYHFEDRSAGALEHSFSSVYVLQEVPYTPGYGQWLRSIAAHEFFHIVTPLNIHSEIIGDFNFAVPTPSEHLWLYEGVTEWASDMMQFRNQSMDLNTLFVQFSGKIEVDNLYFDKSYSLSDISLTSYTPAGNAQFSNIYNRGAMVSALLDIRLLELSNGTKGLREVIIELMNRYGPNNSFSENNFFNMLTTMTYPEINTFIQSYIRGTEVLPIADYFNKLGILYNKDNNTFSLLQNPTVIQQLLFDKWSVNF